MTQIKRIAHRLGETVWEHFVPMLAFLVVVRILLACYPAPVPRPLAEASRSASEIHRANYQQTPSQKACLYVWWADWCGSCRAFWTAYNTDADFKARIDAVYCVIPVNYDQHPIIGFFHGINAPPAFAAPAFRIQFQGFTTKDDLLTRLRITGKPASQQPVDPASYQLNPPPMPGANAPQGKRTATGPATAPATAPAPPDAGPTNADIQKGIEGLSAVLGGIQKTLASAGETNQADALGQINQKLTDLQAVNQKIDELKNALPAPLQSAVQKAIAAELPKLAPNLAGLLSGTPPATGALGAIAGLATTLGFPPAALLAAAGALAYALGSFAWNKLKGNVKVPSNLLSALAAAGQRQAGGLGGATKINNTSTTVPVVVPTDSPPPPQLVTTKTNVVPVQVDQTAQAYATALAEFVRKYPDATNTMMTFDGMMKNLLTANPVS